MTYVALSAGIFLVVFTLIDTFFTVLNYNQRGLLVNRAISAEWRAIHWVVRPLPINVKTVIYRGLTGLTLLSGILLWAAGIVVGFALMFTAAIDEGALKVADGAPRGFWGALYYSMGQFSTVGSSGFTPNATWVSLLSVLETLLCVLLLSIVIAFLVNVFSSIEALRTVCACFPSSSAMVTSPLESLAPYIPREDPSSLENHLATTRQAMNSYFDSIAADHCAIYFYSGKDRFVMPFSAFMLAGTVETLGSGLPAEHPISTLPELTRFTEAYKGNCAQMYNLFRWEKPAAPKPLSRDAFVALATSNPNPGPPSLTRKSENLSAEAYVHRFVRLRTTMAEMGNIGGPRNWDEEYQAYVDWLQIVALSDDFIRRSSQLFDYHPVYEGADTFDIPLDLYGWRAPQTPKPVAA